MQQLLVPSSHPMSHYIKHCRQSLFTPQKRRRREEELTLLLLRLRQSPLLLDSYSPVAYFASLVAKHEAEKLQNELVSLNSKIETLKQALLEVIKVLESDDSAIVDTVWVSTGQPETLRDHCHHAVYGYLHEGEERA